MAQLPINSEMYFQLNGYDVEIIKNGKRFVSFGEIKEIEMAARAYGGFNALLEVMQQMDRVAALPVTKPKEPVIETHDDEKEPHVRHKKRNKKVDQQ